MKYKHVKTGNVIDTPFEVKSKTWLPVPDKKKTKAGSENKNGESAGGKEA